MSDDHERSGSLEIVDLEKSGTMSEGASRRKGGEGENSETSPFDFATSELLEGILQEASDNNDYDKAWIEILKLVKERGLRGQCKDFLWMVDQYEDGAGGASEPRGKGKGRDEGERPQKRPHAEDPTGDGSRKKL